MIQSITCCQTPWPGEIMHNPYQNKNAKFSKQTCDDFHAATHKWTDNVTPHG